MKAPTLYKLETLLKNNEVSALVDDKWVPARPLGYDSLKERVRIAWGVFTGKYDAVVWPGNQ